MNIHELSRCVQLRALDISTNGKQLNPQRLCHIYIGILAEALIDMGPVFEESSFCIKRIAHALCPNMHIMNHDTAELVDPLSVDMETELGRALSRLYLDGSHGSARSLVQATEELIAQLCRSSDDPVGMLHYISATLDLAVIMEHATHQLCDEMIEINIARQGWSLSDCIRGLSALSGRQLALEKQTSGMSLQDLTRIMGQEALRLGVSVEFDMMRGLAANDAQVKLPLGLLGALEPMCLETLNRYNLNRKLDQAAILSKAAGRMIAVASSGDMPEIEAVVARPIALSAMSGAYHKFSA